MVFFCDYLMVD